MGNQVFKILSIDGGGFRGVFAASVLKHIETRIKDSDWRREFQLMAGTSTGSIIASGLATGKSADKISTFYDAYGERIFPKRSCCQKLLNPCGLRRRLYDSVVLQELLEKEFGHIRLGEISHPLFLPATNIETGNVFIMKSNYGQFDRDKDIRLVDAILASCAAPTYFKPREIGDHRGGRKSLDRKRA